MKAFKYAVKGIYSTLLSERNMRIHACVAFYVVLFGLITHLSAWEWAGCIICIGLVTALECVNTALEQLCNELHPEKSDAIGKVKDAAAGAVLCAAAASAAVGGAIFFRSEKITAVLAFARNTPLYAAAAVITIPLWIKFIVGRKHK